MYSRYRDMLVPPRKDIQLLFYMVVGCFAAGHLALYNLDLSDILFRNDAFSLRMVFFFIFWVLVDEILQIKKRELLKNGGFTLEKQDAEEGGYKTPGNNTQDIDTNGIE